MSFFELLQESLPLLLQGLLLTLQLAGLSLVIAMVLGVIAALMGLSKNPILRAINRAFVAVIRCSPLLVQTFFIYFGVTGALGIRMSAFAAGVVALSLNAGGYLSEIFRGGIQGVPIGQHEAGQVLGLSKSQIFFKVTLMQMIKRIVPPMSNEIITLVKDTSLARIIAMQEIIWAGQAFMKSSHGIHGIIWPLFSTGIYYLAFSGILTILFGWIEKKLDYFKV